MFIHHRILKSNMEIHSDSMTITSPDKVSSNIEEELYVVYLSKNSDDTNSNKHLNQKDTSDQFADFSDCNDNSQSSCASNRDKQKKSDDSDKKNDSFNGKDNENSIQKVKHNRSKRCELRASHSDKKFKSNEYADLSESDDDSKHRKSSNNSDEEYHPTSDDTYEYFSGKDDTNLAKREKLKKSHFDNDKSNKYAVTLDSDDHSILSNESNEDCQHENDDDGDDKDKLNSSIDDKNSNKNKKPKGFELQKIHLPNKYKSIYYSDTSGNDDDYTWSQSLNESDNSGDSDDKNESSSNRDSNNELVTPYTRFFKKRTHNIGLDERINILTAYYHYNFSYQKLLSMFNCSTQQIRETVANRKDIVKEYKKQHPDFDLNEMNTQKSRVCNTLSLDERIDMLRAFNHHNPYDCYKIASAFKCSKRQIEYTLANRMALIKEYKKQHPDFDDIEFISPKNRTDDTLSWDKRIDVIKAYQRQHYTPYKLAYMFNCSTRQIHNIIKNRKSIINEYKKQHPDFVEAELKAPNERICNDLSLNKGSLNNKLSLDERIDILRAHKCYHYPYYKLASMFNCSTWQIKNTLINHKSLIELYKKQHPDFDENKEFKKKRVLNVLSLDERIDVIKAYNCQHYTTYQLALIFNCSKAQIQNILLKHEDIIKEYKKQHPDYDENEFEASHTEKNIFKSKCVNKLTLEKCKKVIEAYDKYGDCIKLSRLFNLSVAQIKSIIKKRDGIIKKYTSPTIINNCYNISNNDYHDDIQSESICLNSVNKLSSNAETTVQNVSQKPYTGNRNTNNEDDHKNLNDLSAEDTIKIEDKEFPTQHEKTYGVNDQDNDSYKLYDIYRESTNCINNSGVKISNDMGQLCLLKSNINSKLSNNNQNDSNNDNNNLDSIKLSNDRTLRWDKLYLRKYLQVIKAYDELNSYSVLANRFNCSWILIYDIIENRHIILKVLKNRSQVKLTLIERIDVIRDYVCKNFSYQQLSRIYHCSLAEIKKCIQDRSKYNRIYKSLYPVDKQSKSKVDYFKNDIPSLKKQADILKAFDHYPNEMLISRLYDCSLPQIFKIIGDRDEMLKQCQNSNSQINQFENFTISHHRDILLALEPLVAYAKLINNSAAINIMSQLEGHLNCVNRNKPKSNYSLQKNVKICSYSDALNALNPIGDFTELTNNNSAKNVILQLEMHLVKNFKKS